MKLNPRERFMLIALAVISVLAASYFLLIKPQLDNIDKLNADKELVKAQIQSIETELASGSTVAADIAEVSLLIEEITKVFYPEILKEKVIVQFDEIVNTTDIKNPTIGFSRIVVQEVLSYAQENTVSIYYLKDLANDYFELYPPEKDEAEEEPLPVVESDVSPDMKMLEVIMLNLSLSGTYEQLTDMINEIEELEKTILITELSIQNVIEEDPDTAEISESLDINMGVIIFAIPKIYVQDDEYYEWTFDNKYGKRNPFSKN